MVRIFGRQISRWWLLLLIPLVLPALPLAGIALIIAGNIAGGIFGPPAIWDRTHHAPSRNELVGSYVESKRNWGVRSSGQKATLILRADGSMSISALPADAISSTCVFNGEGTWGGPDGDMKINIAVKSGRAPTECITAGFDLAGHSAPYKLYWVLGDPDSGEGIWLEKR